jgi:alpha-mannosidase
VRSVTDGTEAMLSNLEPPFVMEGARNVFLETVKRGDDNFETKSRATTIILRLYEAFGGHAQARLRISPYLPVVRAYITNLLEDEAEDDELNIMRVDDAQTTTALLRLDFRGFEVKTVKLVLAEHTGAHPSQKESVFPFF